MPQNFLKRKYVPSIHHEVAGEGVPESVTGLSLRQLNRGALQGAAEGCDTGRERPMHPPMRPYPLSQLCRDRHVAYLP